MSFKYRRREIATPGTPAFCVVPGAPSKYLPSAHKLIGKRLGILHHFPFERGIKRLRQRIIRTDLTWCKQHTKLSHKAMVELPISVAHPASASTYWNSNKAIKQRTQHSLTSMFINLPEKFSLKNRHSKAQILALTAGVKSWVVVYLFSNLGLVSWRWFRGHLGDKG